jgi:hypothetical protein
MRGKPFEAGNKFGKGRPRGSRNKRTELMELMEDHGEALIRQCQVMALKGNPTALRLCMERLMPPCRASNNRFRLPRMKTAADLVEALRVVNARGGTRPAECPGGRISLKNSRKPATYVRNCRGRKARARARESAEAGSSKGA